MRKHYQANLIRDGLTFTADLFENNGQCSEFVYVNETMGRRNIHQADFPASNLGTASRDGYLRTMLHSIAVKHIRDLVKLR